MVTTGGMGRIATTAGLTFVCLTSSCAKMIVDLVMEPIPFGSFSRFADKASLKLSRRRKCVWEGWPFRRYAA